ncbi:MAG: cytochrome c biogenesis protein CcsA [Bacteroidetes bacterium]|nr:cytochrome c biogenesis protein CcsA [Bacteroidota bacterium]
MIYKSIVLFSLVSFALSGLGYFITTRKKEESAAEWLAVSRVSFAAGTVLISAVFAILIYLLTTHQFQYNYVYSYSSIDLPVKYLVSTFWAGQEGSFILWIFLLSIIGLLVMQSSKEYEPYVMVSFALANTFLISMISGIHVGDLTIGSSPFKTIYEAFPGQVPDGFIPPDGRGLNPLLQNYWMTIHPPVLFIGFASALVPFSFAFAALWREKYDDWIRPALPWTIWSALALGTGIMLGGYWAYETLGWGGYWAWDPVENGSLVPWLATVACIHTMLVQRKTGTLKRFTIFTALFAFIMVVYSTFLTRSGVLADFSVHSFSSLGLYNQLLLFILTFAGMGLIMMIYRWKRMPAPAYTKEIYSREFAMIAGALVLTLLAIATIIGTSLPVFSQLWGKPITLDATGFNTLALPMAVVLALLIGLGQLLWFSKTGYKVLVSNLILPVTLSVLSTGIIIFSGARDAGMAVLGFAAFFAFFANVQVLVRIIRGNARLAGGALAHIGIAFLLLGFISSGKYDESQGYVLPLGTKVSVFGYDLTYQGPAERDGRDAFKILAEKDGSVSELLPIMYFSTYSQAWMKIPDILVRPAYDLYIEPVTIEKQDTPANSNEIQFKKLESKQVGDLKITFSRFVPLSMNPDDIKIRLDFLVSKNGKEDSVSAVYAIGADRNPRSTPGESPSGVRLLVKSIDASNGLITILVEGADLMALNPKPESLIIEASVKPFIGLVWLGTFVTLTGFSLSIFRRVKTQHTDL